VAQNVVNYTMYETELNLEIVHEKNYHSLLTNSMGICCFFFFSFIIFFFKARKEFIYLYK
jgi:hypothetical protein